MASLAILADRRHRRVRHRLPCGHRRRRPAPADVLDGSRHGFSPRRHGDGCRDAVGHGADRRRPRSSPATGSCRESWAPRMRRSIPTSSSARPRTRRSAPAHWRLMIVLTHRARHRRDEAGEPGLRHARHARRVRRVGGDRGLAAVRGARAARRSARCSGAGSPTSTAGALDPAVGSDVRRHRDLRRDAVALVERGDVLPDGRSPPAACCRSPTRCWPRPCLEHRGWALVLVGGLGAAGGYLAASAMSAWLVPISAGASCGCSTCRPAWR